MEKELAYRMESHGGNGSFLIEIFIGGSRKLTDKDRENVSEHAEKITELIHAETIKKDPRSKERAKKEKEEILSLFQGQDIFVDELPNGYCNRYCCKHLPWFQVTTKIGRIIIGWRKSVIHVEWKDSNIGLFEKNKKSNDLFPDEDVTKGDYFIHACGLEKAKEYIDVILKA